MRPSFTWRLRTREPELGPRTLIMGVLNVTPDSFSDGGLFLDRDRALEQALRMLEEGADLIDVGGESTRPGSKASETAAEAYRGLPAEQELKRVLPVVEALKRARPQAVISIDTYKAAVARAAVEAGAEVVNDISALRWDPAMAATVAELRCGAVLMHMRGRPAQWRKLPPLEDGVGLVSRELAQWAEAAQAAGVERDRIVLDPGFGFGKSFEENYPLLAHFEEFRRLGFPLLAGPSRKSFLGRTLSRNGRDAPPDERLHATLAAVTACILKGAHIVRVHDVRAAVDAAHIADAILRA